VTNSNFRVLRMRGLRVLSGIECGMTTDKISQRPVYSVILRKKCTNEHENLKSPLLRANAAVLFNGIQAPVMMAVSSLRARK
jgi:hypothetical protein